MKFTERDKVLAIVLPAIIVLGAFGLFYLRPKVAERTRVEKALADAIAKSPSNSDLTSKRLEIAKLKKDTDDIDAKLKAVQTKWRYETAFCTAGAQRHD